MDNIYIEYSFIVSPKEPATEILIAELGAAGFESFVENETGVVAYIQKDFWNKEILNDIFILNAGEFSIKYTQQEIAQTNWNAEWEKNFTPIQVDAKVSIRAPFHENPNLPYDIVIEPKMSFGTGHHETTHMMVQHLLEMDVAGMKTLDMGCGTGILAIFAEMRGANPIDAIDIDNWCYENSLENIKRNNSKHIAVFEGDSALLNNKKYDLIIANINRNILLKDMEIYTNCLHKEGVLLLSGFYKEDIPVINEEVIKYGLKLDKILERNNWVALKYLKG
ncbi:50S ribosomal protein L11 methyltransferase [Tenacibaculum maritimum]|uniref:50S ribosomal protein L11 methyltransferase n=1 Tax=Tenacibaculum maritimum TaxID=107401 RepID=UPI001E58A241|nr:50S ribosomal protein L11 methyltransferase [Tenacibaculum maritimum]MCD9585191.1 50S ribosomal protein L11 methyltransferase [Tenacibaculum maritimum]MCD9621021.1 50S ribosomal protein L11 methyltransferase [Tenacibaculum maritimum]MCD9627071.1 50S ribosomal protein L11 methyltransferase [Tenacibaculum maritimum]MCD9631008.1 50S ribosomal protein L11 methyltransferase [Tenacibaculum maritimum]MCD9633588.1 50S ribosomal protein L11 methyltransferase [Tenacibaculum maritimum]